MYLYAKRTIEHHCLWYSIARGAVQALYGAPKGGATPRSPFHEPFVLHSEHSYIVFHNQAILINVVS
jgi:hypothetical protein